MEKSAQIVGYKRNQKGQRIDLDRAKIFHKIQSLQKPMLFSSVHYHYEGILGLSAILPHKHTHTHTAKYLMFCIPEPLSRQFVVLIQHVNQPIILLKKICKKQEA